MKVLKSSFVLSNSTKQNVYEGGKIDSACRNFFEAALKFKSGEDISTLRKNFLQAYTNANNTCRIMLIFLGVIIVMDRKGFNFNFALLQKFFKRILKGKYARATSENWWKDMVSVFAQGDDDVTSLFNNLARKWCTVSNDANPIIVMRELLSCLFVRDAMIDVEKEVNELRRKGLGAVLGFADEKKERLPLRSRTDVPAVAAAAAADDDDDDAIYNNPMMPTIPASAFRRSLDDDLDELAKPLELPKSAVASVSPSVISGDDDDDDDDDAIYNNPMMPTIPASAFRRSLDDDLDELAKPLELPKSAATPTKRKPSRLEKLTAEVTKKFSSLLNNADLRLVYEIPLVAGTHLKTYSGKKILCKYLIERPRINGKFIVSVQIVKVAKGVKNEDIIKEIGELLNSEQSALQ